MRYDPDRRPMDIPPPPSVDEVAGSFGGPVYAFASQPSLEEAGVSTFGLSRDGGPTVLESVSLSYTVWRNPDDRADPGNLADLSDEMRAALDAPPVAPLPEWMLQTRERMRYPWLWEAVRTTRRQDATPEELLLAHARHILMNTFREERVAPSPDGSPPGELTGAPTERAIEHGVPLTLDGEPVEGLRLDADPHVLALAADLGPHGVLTAVLPRAELPYLTLSFATRPQPS
jgi:hypothetical protein